MAIEAKRGCGFRKVGGLYLVGDGLSAGCDRLPIEIGACPVCNSGLHFTRGMTQINALRLWGVHDPCNDIPSVKEQCACCNPADAPAFIMGVGAKFYPTPQDFMKEGVAQGVSKRISQIPKNFKIGETWVYLVHPKAVLKQSEGDEHYAKCKKCSGSGILQGELHDKICVSCGGTGRDSKQPAMLNAARHAPGVFCAFRPRRIEKLIWEHEADEKTLEALRKRNIMPVLVPDGDEDHRG